MKKKLFLFLGLGLIVLLFAACESSNLVNVTFDAKNGSAVTVIDYSKQIEAGGDVYVTEPTTTPANSGKGFLGWYTAASGGDLYQFASTKLTKSITIYAHWNDGPTISWYTKGAGNIASSTADVAAAPTVTKAGFKLEGWYHGLSGKTIYDNIPASFPLSVAENTTYYAYWEPLNSATVNWSHDETYYTSISDSAVIVLNPLTWEWSHEQSFIGLLSTSLYGDEVAWDKAIADGVADYAGDFSKINSGEYGIMKLDYAYYLLGATAYPEDANGDDHIIDGVFDRQVAIEASSSIWTYHLNSNIKFQNGDPVNADTYEYSLKQYLDPVLLNSRSNSYYRTADNKTGYPIKNAFEYFSEDTTWDNVGFTKIDDLSFSIEFNEPVSQMTAMGFGDIRLVHPATYEASLDSERKSSNYGTPVNKFVSYGAYIMKSWDEGQKFVFNKNYDYINKERILYKSYEYTILPSSTPLAAKDLFLSGGLSVLGLNKDFYADFAERENIYRDYSGFAGYLIVNTDNKATHPGILYDIRFRQALLLGLDREYYATNEYAPNLANLLPIPVEIRSYAEDPDPYVESGQHLDLLEELGIPADSTGYLPQRAKELFTAAYNDWIADGNVGKVSLRLLTENDDFSIDMSNGFKRLLEGVFGTDKLEIFLDIRESTVYALATRSHDFDLLFNSVGFGSSSGLQDAYPFIGLIPAFIGASSFGLNSPYEDEAHMPAYIKELQSTYVDGYSDLVDEIVSVDFTNLYAYLTDLIDSESDAYFPAWDNIYELLIAVEDDPETEEDETKEAGWLVGCWFDFIDPYSELSKGFWDSDTSEPYEGANIDIYNWVAALERIFYKWVPLIPVVGRSSATLYADSITILWPDYSEIWGWGPGACRFINTDPEFANGIYVAAANTYIK